MANSGLTHIDVGPELTRSEWESEQTHELVHGNAFPASPVERQLFYRMDLHEWYIYDGSDWINLQGGAGAHAAEEDAPVHGSTSLATADKLIHRDNQGRARVAPPSHNDDIDTLGGRITGIGVHRAWEVHDQPQPPEAHDNARHTTDYEEEGVAATQIESHRTTEVHTEPQPPATHAATHSPGGADPVADDFLVDIVRAVNFVFVPTAAGWDEGATGAGVLWQEPMRNLLRIEDTDPGSIYARTACMGFNIGGNYGRINWDKRFFIIWNYALFRYEAGLTARIQVKRSTAMGDLDDQGIGFQVDNLAMTGEAYNVARGTVSLGNLTVLDANHIEQVQVAIEIDPATPAVRFYIDGSLAGSITNTDHVPQGVAAGGCYLMHSLDRPGNGQLNSASAFMQGKIWQEM